MQGPPVIWLNRHRAQLRLAVRITVAALLSFVVCRLLGLAQSYAAVITSVIVMQASMGASLKAMLDRFFGSLGGAAWGVAVLLALRHSDSFTLGIALTTAVAPLALLAAFKPGYRTAPITAVILLLAPSNSLGPLTPAIQRMLEIGIGSVVALAVALLILPARAHGALADAGGRALVKMGKLAALLMKGPCDQPDPEVIQGLHDDIRKDLADAEAAAGEAMRERAAYLTGGPDPQTIGRTLRRLRNDLAMIGRMTAEPLPEPLRTLLTESTANAAIAVASFLRTTGEAMASQQPSPSLAAVEKAFARHAALVAEARRAGLTRELPDETVGRVFGFAFSLEQLHHNLADLVDRTDELAQNR